MTEAVDRKDYSGMSKEQLIRKLEELELLNRELLEARAQAVGAAPTPGGNMEGGAV